MRTRILSLIPVALSIAALVILAGASFYAGLFTASFQNNLCYATAISHIAKQTDFIAQKKDQASLAGFQGMLANLPLHGYETNCSEILEKLALYDEYAAMNDAKPDALTRQQGDTP